MRTRIISGAVLLPLLLFLIIFGGIPLHAAIFVISIIGIYEFYKALSGKILPVHLFGFAACAVFVPFAEKIVSTGNMFNAFTACFIVLLLSYMVLFHKKCNDRDVFITFFGFYYVCFLLTHIYLVRSYTYGQYFVWLIFIASFVCDTGAYFTGMLLGKHRLIPDLSPKKTIEGAIGGVVWATAASVIFGIVIERKFMLDQVATVFLCTIIGIAGSMLSQIGDLAASSFKRMVGIKDYGNLIPGHGGILDRFDSVIITAPVVYYVMVALIEVL
ncbi:phosphatidate cytidylyltransferase [Lachnospiraceae bacterium NSJ-143]|nr:phosphatidate cytidylyltransferase [Lachnospiraceae bacterium NSJ-143]